MINNLIGNAPIKVKFALKAYFEDIHPPTLVDSYLGPFLKAEVRKFLKQYKIHGTYPWTWDHGKLTKKERREVYNSLFDLLTEEEKEFRLYRIR